MNTDPIRFAAQPDGTRDRSYVAPGLNPHARCHEGFRLADPDDVNSELIESVWVNGRGWFASRYPLRFPVERPIEVGPYPTSATAYAAAVRAGAASSHSSTEAV